MPELLPIREHSTSRGLRFSTRWPVGSEGYCLERQFAEAVDIYQEIGFGRMRQIIQEMWNKHTCDAITAPRTTGETA